MAIDPELLEILCCPETKTELKVMTAEEIANVNSQIEKNALKYKDGKPVDKPLQEGLITVDKKTIYRVDDEIPIMLMEMGIAAEQVQNI